MIYLKRTHSHQDSLAKIENKNPYISNASKPLIYWDSGKSLKKVKLFSNVFQTDCVLPYDFCQFVSV
ncbi:MAG TPA: hypothetical protein DCL00_04760 [Opitutae bacterium]|nr:hypothetical protein [Opitutae bacterium]